MVTRIAPLTEPGHRGRTMRNYNYDLVIELSELLASLWRVDQYLKDAAEGDCVDCGKLWQDIRKNMELLAEKLREEIADHVKSGRFV